MNKFEIKMDNGDIHIVETPWTVKVLVDLINTLDVDKHFISTENEILRLKNIVSIKLIKVTL